MAKGTVYPAEASIWRDPRTGARIRQVTSHASIHHHPFFFIPAYDDGMRWLFVVSHRTGMPRYPEASNQGEHWKGPFPYEQGPIKVYAPQHTHPHPSFSPDGRFVVFTSDRTGYAQVYEVELPED